MLSLLIDIAALFAIVLWGLVGWALGLRHVLTTLATVLVTVLLAIPAGEGAASLLERTGLPHDAAMLVGLAVFTLLSYRAVRSLRTYFVQRFWPHEPTSSARVRAAAVACGAAIGVGWVTLLGSLLLLLPSGGLAARAAIDSVTGRVLVSSLSGPVRLIHDRFPDSTRTLPKNESQALSTPIGTSLPFRRPAAEREDASAADELLRRLNTARREANHTEYIWNLRLADSALQHSQRMYDRRRFEYELEGDSDERIREALGSEADRYATLAEQILWASSIDAGVDMLLADDRARALLSDQRFNEIGIGVVDGGWFNGLIVTLQFGADAGSQLSDPTEDDEEVPEDEEERPEDDIDEPEPLDDMSEPDPSIPPVGGLT